MARDLAAALSSGSDEDDVGDSSGSYGEEEADAPVPGIGVGNGLIDPD